MKIIFEDDFIIAVNKPGGLVVHGDGRTEEESLVDWLSVYVGISRDKQEKIGNPHTLDSGRYFPRWGIVNRLDRDTSGIILIAKDQETFLNLQKQFLEKNVRKEYVALVWGNVDTKELISSGKIISSLNDLGGNAKFKILEPISRHKKDPRIWVCGTGVGERLTKRDAETEIFFLTPVPYGGNKTTLLKLFPITGRTHQLRLHCRFIGHPIVGDKKYGINGIANEHGTSQLQKVFEELDEKDGTRLMLHAKSLEFTHPSTKEKIKIETDTPEEFW